MPAGAYEAQPAARLARGGSGRMGRPAGFARATQEIVRAESASAVAGFVSLCAAASGLAEFARAVPRLVRAFLADVRLAGFVSRRASARARPGSCVRRREIARAESASAAGFVLPRVGVGSGRVRACHAGRRACDRMGRQGAARPGTNVAGRADREAAVGIGRVSDMAVAGGGGAKILARIGLPSYRFRGRALTDR